MDKKRFNELYNRAFEKNYKVFTDFLNLDEQSILEGEYLPCIKFGGYENAERVVAGFGDEIDYSDFPIRIICISPSAPKFADKLSHRDFLGALMNLGIKRELLGDIVISENKAYLFCLESIAKYICESLSRVRHTTVKCSLIDCLPDTAVNQPEEIEINVSSLRADNLIAGVFHLSRKSCSELFSSDRVFVNSRLCQNPSQKTQDGDIISVRGFGRFQVCSPLRTTKKQRTIVAVKIYK